MGGTIQLVGEIPEPRSWPLYGMSRFGKHPYGGNKYRVVFAPTVMMLVGGEFSDGFAGYRVRPAYRHIGNQWIMEKWISGFDHTKMSEEDYDLRNKDPLTGLCLTGPYPSRGTYFHVHTFEGSHPSDGGIDWIVGLIEKASSNDPAKIRMALIAAHEKKEKEDAQYRFDRMRDAERAFGIRAANIGGMVKPTKTAKILRSANELGLPLNGGQCRQIRSQGNGHI